MSANETSKKEEKDMKKDQEMKQLVQQVEMLTTRINYMEKEMYEIRKGNTIGQY